MSKELMPGQRALAYRMRKTALGTCLCLLPLALHGAQFELGEDWEMVVDTTLSYGAAWRVEDRASDNLRDPNADDGNRNFDKGLISNRLSILSDIEITDGSNGVFLRVNGFYDDVYHRSTDHDSPGTYNSDPMYGGSAPSSKDFADGTVDQHGDDLRLLDAFFYTGFLVGDQYASLRIGRQVVSWGESLFIQNSINSANPVDASKANVPGIEIKEILLPVNMVFGQVGLSDRLSMSGYYQFEWEKTEIDAAGSYFSYNDMLDEGGENLLVPHPTIANALFPIPRSKDRTPSDSGQWGLAFHYLAPALNDIELGFYAMNYHNKTPELILDMSDPLAPNYYLEYLEDIRLYGISAGTVIGGTNVGLEVSYRDGQPVATANPAMAQVPYTRADMVQGQVSFVHLTGPNILADNVTLMGEVGANHVNDLNDGELFDVDQTAWGYTLSGTFDYNRAMPGIDLKVPVVISHGVDGVSASQASGFVEDVKKASVGLEAVYLRNLEASLNYTAFFGGGDRNALRDRDFIAFNLKYGF